MAINFPGPYEVRLKYRYSLLEHTMRLNCDVDGTVEVGQPASTVMIKRRSGTTASLDTVVSDWISRIQPMYYTGVEFFDCTLWKYIPYSFISTYVTTSVIAANGTSTNLPVLAHQTVFTFRTQEGGIMRINLLEDSSASLAVESPPYASAPEQALSAFVVSTNNYWLARDTSYPVVGLRCSHGQNEASFRQRYRT